MWSSSSLLQGVNGVWQGQRVRVWWILEEGWWIEEQAGDNPVTVGAREHTGMLTSVVSFHPLLSSLFGFFISVWDLHTSLTSLPSATMWLLKLTAHSFTLFMSWANWFVRLGFTLHLEDLCEGLKIVMMVSIITVLYFKVLFDVSLGQMWLSLFYFFFNLHILVL